MKNGCWVGRAENHSFNTWTSFAPQADLWPHLLDCSQDSELRSGCRDHRMNRAHLDQEHLQVLNFIFIY